MAKRIFSQVRKETPEGGAEEDDGAADLFASKMLLSLANAPVLHPSPTEHLSSDDSSCAVSVSTIGSRSGRPESTRSGADSKCFDSGDDEEEDYEDGMGSRSSSPFSLDEEGERKRSRGLRTAKSITLDELRLYFDKPIEDAAKIIGICSTLLKKICRKYNIKRWPYRQIKSLDRTIYCLRLAAQNARPAEQERFNSQIRLLESRRTELIESSASSGHKRAAASSEMAGAELIADITSLQRRAVSLGKPLQQRKSSSSSLSSPSSSSSSSSESHHSHQGITSTVGSSTSSTQSSNPISMNQQPQLFNANSHNHHNHPWLLQPVHLPASFGGAVAAPQAPKPLLAPGPPPPPPPPPLPSHHPLSPSAPQQS